MRRRPITGVSGRVARISVVLVLALVLIAVIVFVLPRLIVPTVTADALRDVPDAADRHALVDSRLKLQNDVRTTMLQMLGGLALLAGAFLTYRQLRLNHEGHITERFTNAVDQLGSGSPAVRAGGIYALARIDRDSSVDHEPIMEILAAFVRQRSGERNGPRAGEGGAVDRLPADLQAAATALGRRPAERRRSEVARINLRSAALARVHLRGAHYERMALTKADFRRSHVSGIHLNGALLRASTFDHAVMENAHLDGAVLIGASLRDVRLDGTTLNGAWLLGADLRGAQWGRARYRSAHADPQPIVSWLQQTLGDSPWAWARAAEILDTPTEGQIEKLARLMSAPFESAEHRAALKEGMRQVRFHLERRLRAGGDADVTSEAVERALTVQGMPAAGERPGNTIGA